MASRAVPSPHLRARLALGFGLLAVALVAVLPPVAWVPALAAIVLGADARERSRRAGRKDLAALAGLVLGAVAIAVGIALVVAALGAG